MSTQTHSMSYLIQDFSQVFFFSFSRKKKDQDPKPATHHTTNHQGGKETRGGNREKDMFTVSHPSPHEAARIASIHISSMSSNPLLHLQFPTPASLADLHDHLAKDTLRHLAASRVLVARSSSSDGVGCDSAPSSEAGGTIASFVKWDVVGVSTTLGSRRLEAGESRHTGEHQGHEDEEEEEEEGDEDEEWPESANQEYLTAYSSAASTARREAIGSRPFVRE
ncbi:GNAT family acetyltransferase [Colletotrichum truncatum]|uniref:GNAT family acetyltransferase n=1 Tax=Colletotrichum truncatum TaxID=5467 RepID=A0ACC3YQR9_COLTU|nr:GNAT family acetyltransferase [Colletotrichum truncatum]KAF6798977.1 GNAT family acetyltransferase [Colletotrichum truncatum]